jgi:soluble lytic murein transglycosylase
MEWIERYRWWLFVLIFLAGLVTLLERWQTWHENSHDKVILAAAARYGVDAALIKAVVWRESRFNPRAKGRKGEIGLMQIRKEAAGEWAQAEHVALFTAQQLYDPRKNTLAGTWYLGKLLRRYQQTGDPVPYALADFNAGRANVLRWNKGAAATNSMAFVSQIDFPSTREYVRSVMKRYQHYRPLFPPKVKRPEEQAVLRSPCFLTRQLLASCAACKSPRRRSYSRW